MNYSILSLAKVQRLFAVLAILALVFGPMSPAFANQGQGQGQGQGQQGGGAVWTNIGPCGSPQNVNHYTEGQGFYGHGTGFAANTEYAWIVKEPGNGGDEIESGTITTDADGSFCELLFVLDSTHVGGPYQFNVGDSKNDNFSVDAKVVPTYVDLAVTKSVNESNPAVADVLTYTITVTNNGTAVATDVLVTDTLEAGLTFNSANPAPISTGPLQWEFASIATGTSEVITVEVEVASGTEGIVLTNEVSVTSEEEDADTDDNQDSVDVEVVEPILGCTDQSALNPTTGATVDDGSCMYMCVYSDISTMTSDGVAVEVTPHQNWVQTLSEGDGEWIWSTNGNGTVSFTKSFYSDVDATGNLEIAVDNFYTAELNNIPVSCSGVSGNNHASATTCSVSVDAGLNTLVISALNEFGAPSNPPNDPAGVIFELTVKDATCSPVVENGGSITIVKDFVDEAPESWSFDFIGDFGEFTLEDGDDSITFSNLEADEYLLNEVVTGNWSVPAVSCTDGSGAGQGEDQLVVALGEGEDVTCTFTNREKEPEAPLCIGGNLLLNGSFEDPVIGSDWTLVDVVTNWLISGVTQFELWNTFNGSGNDVADDGAQNLELDSTGSGTITQTINTVAGNEYKVAFAFSPRAGVTDNEVDVGADGVVLGSVSADGSANSTNVWSDHYFTFTATDSSTDITFSDLSVSDSLGTLLDDTQVCLTEDNSAPLYTVYGNVWNDENENDERDLEGEEYTEDTLEGWLVTITDGEFIATTTSDEFGYYEFQVPAGNYTITQEMQDNWALTYPNEGFHEVCVPIACAEVSFVEAVVSFFIPTAHAQVAGFGPFDFGNVRTAPGYSQGSYGGGGNGRSISLRDDTPDGEVAGDSTSRPEGEVLGEATSVMPVGAPNTGAGGASQNVPSAHLHALLAILSASPMRKKHG